LCPEYPISTLLFSNLCSLFIIPDINTITIYYEHILVKNNDDNLLILRRIFKALQNGRNWSAKWAKLVCKMGEIDEQFRRIWFAKGHEMRNKKCENGEKN